MRKKTPKPSNTTQLPLASAHLAVVRGGGTLVGNPGKALLIPAVQLLGGQEGEE